MYKKTIHELQLQLDSKTFDERISELEKILKNKELEHMEAVEGNRK